MIVGGMNGTQKVGPGWFPHWAPPAVGSSALRGRGRTKLLARWIAAHPALFVEAYGRLVPTEARDAAFAEGWNYGKVPGTDGLPRVTMTMVRDARLLVGFQAIHRTFRGRSEGSGSPVHVGKAPARERDLVDLAVEEELAAQVKALRVEVSELRQLVLGLGRHLGAPMVARHE